MESNQHLTMDISRPIITEWKEYFDHGFKIFSRNNGIINSKDPSFLLPPVELKIENANDFSFKEDSEINSKIEKLEVEKESERKIFDLNSIEVKDPEFEKEAGMLKESKEVKEFQVGNEISFANNRFSFEELKPHITDAKKGLNFSLGNLSMCNSLANLNNIDGPRSIDIDKSLEIKEDLAITDSFSPNKITPDKIVNESIEMNAKLDLESNDIINDVFENKYASKNRDKEIKNLLDKLNAYKYQNKIMLEENNKLLEIINLFKILQNMEKENVSSPVLMIEKAKEKDNILIQLNNSIDIVNTEKIETEPNENAEKTNKDTFQLLDSTKETKPSEDAVTANSKAPGERVYNIERNFSFARVDSFSTNFVVEKPEPQIVVVGSENIYIQGKEVNLNAKQLNQNPIENTHDICNVATFSPKKEESGDAATISLNKTNIIGDNNNNNNNINSNYLSFKDFPDNQDNQQITEPTKSIQNKSSTIGKNYIDPNKPKKKSYGKMHEYKTKLNEKESNKGRQPVQVQSTNTQPSQTPKTFIKINNSQTNSSSQNNSKNITDNHHNNFLLKPINNNMTNTLRSNKSNDKLKDDLKLDTNLTNISNYSHYSHSNTYNHNNNISINSTSNQENQRNLENESRLKSNRYDGNINNYFEDDQNDLIKPSDYANKNKTFSYLNYTPPSNFSNTNSTFKDLQNDRENRHVFSSTHKNYFIDREKETMNSENHSEKDEKYSYNKIIRMLEKYREMNEKLMTNLNEKNFLSQPVVIDLDKRKRGVENLKEILDYITITKTLEEKRDQIIPFYLIDKRKLYENIVNYIFYNKESTSIISHVSKSPSSSHMSSKRNLKA